MPDNPLRTHSPSLQTLGLIALGLLIHAVFAGVLTLSVDEAHYALYAQHLAWSYFDHPPLVGWIQWPLVVTAQPDWALRLIPQGLWLMSTAMAWLLAERLRLQIPQWQSASEPGEPGRWAVLMVLLGPVFHVLAVGLLPDTLLMTLVLALMLTTLRLCERKGQGWHLWLALGLLLGVAGLSKYTAILFAFASVGALWINLGWRIFVRPGLWFCVLVALLLVSPVFIWNATHDWISFRYQLDHSSGGSWKAHRLLTFAGLQVVAFGPLVLAALIGIGRFLKASPNRLVFGLSLFVLVPLLVTAFMAGGGRSLPHWMGPAWLAAIALGANPVAQHWNEGKRKLLGTLTWIQAGMCTAAFTALFFIGIPGLSAEHPIHQKNPLADLWGWDEAGALATTLATQQNIRTLGVGNWTLASRLAWYARPLPVVVLDDRFDQFDLWFADLEPGQDMLFVNWSQVPYPAPVGEHQFRECKLVGEFTALRFGRETSHFEYLACHQWQGSR